MSIIYTHKIYWLSYIAFLFSCSLLQSNTIIRALCYQESQYNSHWNSLFALKPYLLKYGLKFVNEKPDVIFCNRVTSQVLSYNCPIIILEKYDAASLHSVSRKALSDPTYKHLIKGIFKNYTLRPLSLYNAIHSANCYHFQLINTYAHLQTPQALRKLSPDDLTKIQCVVWNLHESAFTAKKSTLKDYHINFNQKRPIDVFFIGSVSMPNFNPQFNQLYLWHRVTAIRTIKSISGISTIATSRPIPYHDYINLITKSKIVVSPWGLGEWCHRDYEAIHCGAVLIKPDTSFVQAIPDIYQNNSTYVPCKPDFSDLQQKVDHILTHYESYQPMRERAKKLLVDSWDMDALAKMFVNHVRQVLNTDKV